MNKKSQKTSRAAGIVLAICMIVLGILMFAFPLGSLLISTWLFVIGVTTMIETFAKPEKEE